MNGSDNESHIFFITNTFNGDLVHDNCNDNGSCMSLELSEKNNF